MNFLDLFPFVSHGTIVKIVDQDFNSLYFGRMEQFRSDNHEIKSKYYPLIVECGKIVCIFHEDYYIVIQVYLPY